AKSPYLSPSRGESIGFPQIFKPANGPAMSETNTIFAAWAATVADALAALEAEGALPAGLPLNNVAVEPPRDPAHGDLATNAAMVLAKPVGMNPRALAELLVGKLSALPQVTEASIAGPGFINLRLADSAWL